MQKHAFEYTWGSGATSRTDTLNLSVWALQVPSSIKPVVTCKRLKVVRDRVSTALTKADNNKIGPGKRPRPDAAGGKTSASASDAKWKAWTHMLK